MIQKLLILSFGFFILTIDLPLLGAEPKAAYEVSEMINIALKRSELLTAQEKSLESSKYAKDQAGAWQNPSVSFNAGLKSASEKNGFAYDIGITQPFYFPGKQKAAGDIAEVQKKIAGLNLTEARLFVRYSVIRLSYQYALADELSKHLEERVIRFKIIRKYLASRPFASPKKRMEKHVVEMKLVLLQKSLDEARSRKDVFWAKLNLFLNMHEPVKVKAPWFNKTEILKWDALQTKVESGNIDLKKQMLLLERTKAETSLARKFAYPDFSLSILYREDTVPDIERFVGAGITVNVPLWNTNKFGSKSMEASVEAEKARAAYAKREINQTLISSFIEYEIAQKNLERLPMSLFEEVHSRLADADDSFDKGLIDLVTYGEVESQAYEMHLSVLGAQYDYVDKYAALQILQGSEDFILSENTRKNP